MRPPRDAVPILHTHHLEGQNDGDQEQRGPVHSPKCPRVLEDIRLRRPAEIVELAQVGEGAGAEGEGGGVDDGGFRIETVCPGGEVGEVFGWVGAGVGVPGVGLGILVVPEEEVGEEAHLRLRWAIG